MRASRYPRASIIPRVRARSTLNYGSAVELADTTTPGDRVRLVGDDNGV